MLAPSSLPGPQSETRSLPVSAFLFRMYWMLAGHPVVFLTALAMYVNHLQSSVLVNGLYLLLMVLPVAARFADFKLHHGETAEGKPSTMSDCVGYSIKALSIYAILWVAAQVLARYAPV